MMNTTVTLPVDFCRERNTFDLKAPKENADILTYQGNKATWRYGDDDRVFMIPVEIINALPENNNLFRDIIAYVSQAYIDAGFPLSGRIQTTLRQITDGIGIAYNGDRAKEIEDILTFAQMYRIQNQILYRTEKGKYVEYRATFGFVESMIRETRINGIDINPRYAKITIKLNDIYCQVLSGKLPMAPVPVAALRVANSGPRRLRTSTKNLIYRLAAFAPKTQIELTVGKLQEILGYKSARPDKLRTQIENILEQLRPVMIQNYYYVPEKQKYVITLTNGGT